MVSTFNHTRLSIARRRRALTKKQFADHLGIQPRSVTGFESGEYVPSAETLGKLSEILNFPVAFFVGDDLEEPVADGVSFRAMSKMTAAQRNAALATGAIAFLLNRWVEDRFELPAPDLLDLRHETPEGAATSLRRYWERGERPIKNMIHLLEAKGVRVFSLAENCKEIDAYSLWKDGVPFVFLNTYKSAEHSRMDAAHELGHLVLHQHGAPNGQEAEKEGNAFASAFLMPAASVTAVAPALPSVPRLLTLKKKWAVSISALIVRLHRLGLLSDWHYRTLCIQIQQKGYRQTEPDSIQRETSIVWEKVFSELRSEGIGKGRIAENLSIYSDEIEKLVFGLVMMGISNSYQRPKTTTRKSHHLRLVEQA